MSARPAAAVPCRSLAAVAALLLTALTLLPGGVALAAGSPTLLRVAALAPDAAPVDVYLDAVPLLSGATFRTVGSYAAVTPGAHTLSLRAAGEPASAAPIASAPTTLTEGGAFTAAVLGAAPALQVSVFTDDFTLPPAGQAKVRVLHAAPSVPNVDAAVKGGPVLFRDVAYGKPTAYDAVKPGSYDLQMYKAGTSEVLWTIAGVGVRAGSVYTLAAVGGAGKPLEVLPLADAAGVGVAPAGGVQTGAGGALTDHTGALAVAAVGSLALAAALTVVALRRREQVAQGS